MFKLVLPAFLLSALALGAWQFAAVGGTAVQAHHVGDTYDCEDFDNQSMAQGHFNAHPGDQDNLDHDNDDIACEQYNYSDDEEEEEDDDTPCNYSNVHLNPGYPGYPGYPVPGYPYPPIYGNICDPHPAPYVPAIVPAPSRPSHITLVIADTTLDCNQETAVVARLMYPNGLGAYGHMVQFQSTVGTVFSNVLTDQGGYAQTRFVAPFTPGQVQITVLGDGLVHTQTVSVTCPMPVYPVYPPPGQVPPTFKPPSTGDAGLVDAGSGNSTLLLAGLAAMVVSLPLAAAVVAKQRR